MRIAVFYPKDRSAAWSMGGGLPATLRRMGHAVTDGAIRPGAGSAADIEAARVTMPALEHLRSMDAILISGPEHLIPWLDEIYGKYEWKQLQARKAAWLHESLFREDYSIQFDQIQPWADEYFFPAVQDAEFCDQESFAKGHSHWLPFGVDTEVFKPDGFEKKEWPVAFIGGIYEKRARFLRALSRHAIPPIRIGGVMIDVMGFQALESAKRLADCYRRTSVFFNLPALSQCLVSKVYEVMACGTFLLTPMLSADRGVAKNQAAFTSGHHLVYYRSSNLPYVAQLLREWSSEEKSAEREMIAASGCREAHANHSLENRLKVIMEKLAIPVAVQ
jgi:glycosyltransferase involved in cell wall biosynthesis